MKNNKGITLVALIITIIVMLILAGISISVLVGEDGIISQAQDATKKYSMEEKIERIVLNKQFETDIFGNRLNSSKRLQDGVRQLAIKSIETDIDPNKLVVYYEELNDTIFILYRMDLENTPEEIEKLESNGVYKFIGDANKDGILDKGDSNILSGYANEEDDDIVDSCDFNDDDLVSIEDSLILDYILAKTDGYTLHKNCIENGIWDIVE